MLGAGSQYQLIPRSINSRVQHQFLHRAAQILQSFLLRVVVEEIIFPAYQSFIYTESEILIGLVTVIPHRQLQILLFFLSILQHIVATFGNGIDVLLILELNQSLLRSILTAVVTLCKLADRRNFLTSSQFSLFNILSNLINDALVFCFNHETVPIQI